jgi:hypothetical protein
MVRFFSDIFWFEIPLSLSDRIQYRFWHNKSSLEHETIIWHSTTISPSVKKSFGRSTLDQNLFNAG